MGTRAVFSISLEEAHSKSFKFWVIDFKAVLFLVVKQLFMGPKHSTVVIYGAKSSNIVAKLLLSRKYNNFLKLWHQKQILLIGLVIRLNQSNHNKLYMVFWWKKLDLGSNLYKLIKLINNKNNPNKPYSWTLPLRSAQTRQQILRYLKYGRLKPLSSSLRG